MKYSDKIILKICIQIIEMFNKQISINTTLQVNKTYLFLFVFSSKPVGIIRKLFAVEYNIKQ